MNSTRYILLLLLLLLLLVLLLPFRAQGEVRKSIIVLDASGSMWGVVEGRPKIQIAKELFGELVREWEPDVHLGVVAYGHRRKGDCSDIETLVPVGPLDPAAALDRVNSLNPKGKTPLSQAVRQAAEELRYTEDKATVILISDGRETCHLDPCALGKTLEETGVDFTVHVVGFDIAGDEAGGLRCLAENTGGLYLPANDAGELRSALMETSRIVAEKPPAVTAKGRIWLDKTEFSPDEKVAVHFEVEGDLHDSAWIGIVPSHVEHGSEAANDRFDLSYQYLKGRRSGTLVFDAPGRIDAYDVRLHDTDHAGNELASVSFTMATATAGMTLDKTTFIPGEKIRLTYETSIPLAKKAWVGIVPSDVPHGSEAQNDRHDVAYRYLGGKPAGTLLFDAPSKVGSYDFRLHDTDDGGSELAHIPFDVVMAQAELSLARTVFEPGETIEVSFRVPEGLADNAWIGIIPAAVPHGSEATNDRHDLSYRYLKGKTSGTLAFQAPGEAGLYDFRAHDTDSNGNEIAHVGFEVQ